VHALKVEGRNFKITDEYVPAPEDLVFSPQLVPEHVIPAVEQALAKSEGHALVFLPGEGEVNAAIREFRKKNFKNCEALPLMGGMPPEEQDKVMMFDDRGGTKRMIVFCTNVAETSLTV
jgi:HrpA-like RNA helicase